jgi:SOS response regulatory protein OraA/RecX
VTRRRETPAEGRARRGAVDDPAAVLDAAARFLEVRPRSIDEVRRRLREAGYRAGLVDGAIERLADLGMLDDEAFARAWVESRDRARPRGERALRSELRRKGVAGAIVADVLGERQTASAESGQAGDPRSAGDPGSARDPGSSGDRASSVSADDVAAARLLARRGGAVAREPDLRRRRAKAYALLARHGFDPDVAGRALAAWMAEADPIAEE